MSLRRLELGEHRANSNRAAQLASTLKATCLSTRLAMHWAPRALLHVHRVTVDLFTAVPLLFSLQIRSCAVMDEMSLPSLQGCSTGCRLAATNRLSSAD